ncbi:TonB-dependent receptor [Terriglobus roseus]|uniref:TonB-dependent Receptor Plug Domain n=1 Tax=Terriglobus roseus TaxID=392734 RepID=A0A1H4QRE7_9BACT|nr:TonB-dependent receptor [Terriglobus roseus]SEC22249.1 TonB-dependent Receptor Plug Domain [Terriglobus roseus]
MNQFLTSKTFWASAVLACSLANTSIGSGQTAALGNISGIVRDASGAVVPGATVTLINSGTGAKRDVTTDSDGHYVATFLQPGTYEVIATGTGFGRLDQKNISITVGNTNSVDVTLPAASVSTDVTVTTESLLLDTDKTDVSQTISEQMISNLPVNGRRFDNFVLLTPNVVPDGNSGLLSFRGISGLYNTNLIDGANNNQAFFSEARGRSIGAPYVFPIDAIKEFQSASSGYSAEFGQAAGGVVNAITKSGTNSFHGDAYEYYRTPGFNALDPTNKFNGVTQNSAISLVKTIKVQHQFGASIGGPIIKDKLFFHAVYDGYRRINPIVYLSSYNTATQSIGQLAALCDGRTSNYLTRGAAIYPSVITGISAAQCTQAVNFIGTQLGAFSRNTTQDIFLPRLDYQITPKTHLSASFLWENLKIPNGYNSSVTVNNGGVSQNGGINFHERFLFANAETALSSNSTNVVHFQWSRDLETASTNSGGPALSLTNLFSYGETSALPRGAFPDEHRWQITDIYNTVRGKHNIKVGVDVNLIHEQIANLFQGDGSFSYNTGTAEFNFANWIQDVYRANGGRHYNSFAQVTDPITGIGADDFWNKNLDVFAQDDWKITPKLLLSLGARYDVQLVPQPERPNLSSPVAQLYTSTINIDYHMAAPRFGFAYNPTPTTVVRGGYGLFFALTSNSTFYANRRENGVYQQQFNVSATTAPNSPYVTAGATCTPTAGTNRCFAQSGAYASYAPIGGIPAFTPPGPASVNLVTGTPTPAVNPGLPTSVLAARGNDPGFLNPYTHSFDLAVEQQLPGRATLTVSYVGTRGMRLPIFVDTNVDPASAAVRTYTYIAPGGATTVIPVTTYTRRLYNTTGSMLTGFSDVNSWYHSMVASFRKPLSHGVEVLANYTWAKNMDGGQVSGVNGTFNGTDTPLDPFARGHRQGRSAEYSRSDIDVRGRFVGSVVATSSFPIANRFAAYAANGWQLTTTVTAQTGLPVTAFLNNSPTSPIGNGGLSFAALSLNNSGTPARVPTQVAPRNGFAGPGIHNTDLRISRQFPFLREGMRLEFAAEAFNIANHRNILGVSSTYLAYTAGGTTSQGTACPTSAGTGTGNGCLVPYTATQFQNQTSTSSTLYGPRQLQLLGRIYF